ncbi:hypothetical protein [Lysinibacillus xylanilyticus]|uniref:hypothetical protein n=1 Tax=Lysinibacillus xylanilyticus TaxID=582475 RepID=UPI0037FBDF96
MKQKEFEYEFDDIHIKRFVKLDNNIEKISTSKKRGVKFLFIIFLFLIIPYKQLDFDGTKHKNYFFYNDFSNEDKSSKTEIVVSLDKKSNAASVNVNDLEEKQQFESKGHVWIVFFILTFLSFFLYVLLTFLFKQRIIDALINNNEGKKGISRLKSRLKEVYKYLILNKYGLRWYFRIFLIDYSLSNFLKEEDLGNDDNVNFYSENDDIYWYTYKDFEKGVCLVSVKESLLKRINKKFILEANNWSNLTRTILLTIIVICTSVILKIEIFEVFFSKNIMNLISIEELLLSFLLIYIIIRIFSRGSEVALAFYKDVVGVNSKIFFYSHHTINLSISKPEGSFVGFAYKNKHYSSLLRRSSRLSLAIHSLLEIILLYAVAYWIVFYLMIDSSSSFLATFLFSFSISAFNFSFMSYDLFILTILHVSQVGLSMVLILLSIAQYLSDEDITEQEEEFYYNVALYKNISNIEKSLEYDKKELNSPRYHQIIGKLNEYEKLKNLFERLKTK